MESAILACLEKTRSKRPQTARELIRLLGRCPSANEWSLDQADAWWGRHERGQIDRPAESSGSTMPNEYDATIDHS
ncbi:hypothetical protein OAS39_12260 [Pirellulales bacterium]|nr:hypothetical protein [Pirellulales bacterium]